MKSICSINIIIFLIVFLQLKDYPFERLTIVYPFETETKHYMYVYMDLNWLTKPFMTYRSAIKFASDLIAGIYVYASFQQR